MEGRVNERGKGKRDLSTEVRGRFRTIFSSNEFINKAQSVGAYSAVFMAAFLIALISASAFTPVDNTEAETVSATISDGCTLSVSASSTVDMDFSATASGTTAIGNGTLTTNSTCTSGYKVFMSMNNNNANGNRLYLDGDSSSSSYLAPTTGSTTAPTVLTANTWGWALAKNASWTDTTMQNYGFDTSYTPGVQVSTTSKFAQMPLKGSEALVQASDTVSGSGGDVQNIYYGVAANSAMQAGTYRGTIVYSAVSNGSSSSTETIAIAPASGYTTGGETVTISTDIYSSMSDSQLMSDLSATIGGNACTITGVSRGSDGSLKIACTTPTGSKGAKDVAVSSTIFSKTWTLASGYDYRAPDIFSITTMQAMTSSICAETTTPTAAATNLDSTGAHIGDTSYVPEKVLTDTRDNRQYLIRKLADGNCWMVSNLMLNFTTSTTLTPADSDVSANWTPGVATQTTDGTSWHPDDSETSYDTVHSYTTDNLWINDAGTSTTTTAPAIGSDDYYIRRLGNYYTWYAATAGTGAYSTTSSSPDAAGSICPKGWQLPTNTITMNADGNRYSYENLLMTVYGIEDSSIGSIATRATPLSFIFSGRYDYAGSVGWQGNSGVFWSASAITNRSAYTLDLFASRISPSGSSNKVHGYSTRCVAR